MVAVASADTRRSFCHHRYQLLPRLLVGPTTRETTDKALTRNKMKKEERILRRPKHSGRHSFSLHLSTLPMRTNYPENADRHTSIVPLQHSPAAFPPFFSFYFFFIYLIMCVCGWKCDAFFPPTTAVSKIAGHPKYVRLLGVLRYIRPVSLTDLLLPHSLALLCPPPACVTLPDKSVAVACEDLFIAMRERRAAGFGSSASLSS